MILGAGPYKGHPFRVNRQPITGLLFREFDRGHWNEIYIAGPSQSSKSLCGFVIPTLRDVHELGLDALVGTPEADMMSDKWDKDFLPVLENSPALRPLIPTKGPGAKGGRIKDRITLGNGVDIKVMTRGGKDTAKAGYSSPRLRLTEAAGWSQKAEASQEGGPFRQILARMRAFRRDDPRRQLTVEGTFSVADELPALARGADDDERFKSTRSTIQSPCPHCGKFINPERKYLVGWQGAESEHEVRDLAAWQCPKCSALIDDAERLKSLRDCVLVHAGQRVTRTGRVMGEAPPTSTLWFAWTSWHNTLLGAADIALDEWEATTYEEGTQERDDAERALCQFVHGKPYKPKAGANDPLEAKAVRKRVAEWRRNVIPHDTVAVSVGIDLGDWTGWPLVVAHRERGQKHVPSYGAFDIKRNKSDHLESRIVAALHQYADELELGFPHEGHDGEYIPDKVWIDGGYQPDAVAQFIRERGGVDQDRYFLVRGRGKSNGGNYTHKSRVAGSTIAIGKQWYMQPNYDRRIYEITFNADWWKLDLDARMRAELERKGALSFFLAETKNEHARISNHICNEQYRETWKPGKGLVSEWVKTGDNHLKDAGAMALGAGDHGGVKLVDVVETSPAANFYAKLGAK